MRKLYCSKLVVLGIAGSIFCSLIILPADARRAYDSSGSSSQSSSSTQNPHAINQFSPPSATTSTSASKSSQSAAPKANQYVSPRNQYTPPQNQYQQEQVTHPYPHQTQSNGTNFYGISPEQLSGGAVNRENTYPANGGGGRGGYDPRWNPNFGTGAGAQTMARESGGLAQSLRDNFPLPMNGDEAQMFQVSDFAARSNGGMQNRSR